MSSDLWHQGCPPAPTLRPASPRQVSRHLLLSPPEAGSCATAQVEESRWPPASAGVWVRLEVALAEGLAAAIGRDLRPQRTAEPVDLRLDLGGRVGILMAEHRQESANRLRTTRTAPAWVIRSASRLSWQSWASAAKTASLAARCPKRLLGSGRRRKGIEREEGLPRPRLLFEGGQQLGHLGVQVVAWVVELGTEEGDERATGPHVWGKESVWKVV